ncbi:MAG: hypothetical protein Q8S27_18135 [Hoeflea sp.]|uniref:hypothetical protein n=1 Tax=Parvibaculum sp. TaxID=2024848 RepID=UPI002730C650|nr:hypothetical protein [Parvibaculum sp.]MDP2148008.1 hypothetical protein [Parvibaculum sp.]MDP3526497.1 hypothetical protein [Hoeflea sp.]MDZ7601841.1 hypothetical protein [Hoeflea sp.]
MPKKPVFQFYAARGEVRIGSRHFQLPQHPRTRIALGSGLIVGGMLGFLPVLGFWMIPLGLLVLSQDLPVVRRWRRNFVVRMERRAADRRARKAGRPDATQAGDTPDQKE